MCCSLPLLSSLTISSLFFFSNCNFNYGRERARSKYMLNDLVPSNRVSSSFAHTHTQTHTHTINTANRGEFVTVKHESTMMRYVVSVKHAVRLRLARPCCAQLVKLVAYPGVQWSACTTGSHRRGPCCLAYGRYHVVACAVKGNLHWP